MPEHFIISYETNVYERLNCGYISEPPWLMPPPNIVVDAEVFLSQSIEIAGQCKKSREPYTVTER